MKEFLNDFVEIPNRDLKSLGRTRSKTPSKASLIFSVKRFKARRRSSDRGGRAIDARGVLDAVTVGLASRLAQNGSPNPSAVCAAYDDLLSNKKFMRSYSRATADEASVSSALNLQSAVSEV